jgi:adenosylhomocysteinase
MSDAGININFVKDRMKVLHIVSQRLNISARVGMSLHIEPKTACLAIALHEAGAQVFLCASNPLSTKDYAVAALIDAGVEVFARAGESDAEYVEGLNMVLDEKPEIIVDDGGDLGIEAYKRGLRVRGVSEETTTGTRRYRALEATGELPFPVIDTNGARCKHLFDNRFGTGQSALEGIMRSTNVSIAGKNFVVVGFGDVGKGIAERARGMGAHVIVAEVDPVRALEAYMDGFSVMSLSRAAKVGEVFVTATGDIDAISMEHIKLMKDGAILANAGHFDVEIDRRIKDYPKAEVKQCVERYDIDGKNIYLLGKGRLVNLVCADGHPIEIMDLSFSLQALAVKYLLESKLENRVYPYPAELDELVAKLKLASMGIEIDTLTDAQIEYLQRYEFGI